MCWGLENGGDNSRLRIGQVASRFTMIHIRCLALDFCGSQLLTPPASASELGKRIWKGVTSGTLAPNSSWKPSKYGARSWRPSLLPRCAFRAKYCVYSVAHLPGRIIDNIDVRGHRLANPASIEGGEVKALQTAGLFLSSPLWFLKILIALIS